MGFIFQSFDLNVAFYCGQCSKYAVSKDNSIYNNLPIVLQISHGQIVETKKIVPTSNHIMFVTFSTGETTKNAQNEPE